MTSMESHLRSHMMPDWEIACSWYWIHFMIGLGSIAADLLNL